VGDLKNFIKELGYAMEVTKNERTNESDILIQVTGRGRKQPTESETMKAEIEEAEKKKNTRERALSHDN
jgi:hypothetical protein